MDAFEDDDPMDYFTSQQEHLHHRQQQQNELRRLPSSSSKLETKSTSNIMGNGELLEDDPIPGDHEQGNPKTPSSSSPPNTNLTNTNANTNTNNKLMLVDQADSKEASKDAGSWSSHATAVLLDVFRDKRVAINGRNFRGEEWEELAAGVNERCQSLASTSTGTAAAANAGASRVEPWKNAKQCSYKMSNLKRKYKSEKELQQLSSGGGTGMSSWQWFAKMDTIFGNDPKYTTGSSFGGDDEFGIVNLDNNNFKSSAAAAAAAGFLSDLPTSKSASTNNLDGCSPSPRPEVESSPRSDQLLSGYSAGKQQHVSKNKRQCLGVSSSPLAGAAAPAAATSSEVLLPGSFGESMKVVIAQQKEMLHLLRELVTSKPQLQRHEQELTEVGGGRDVLDLKLKIESADRELSFLKQVCEAKEKDLKDAVLAYEDKSRLKNELVGRLLDVVYEKELSKMRRLVSMDRNLDSMLQQQQQQQQHRHDHRL